MFDREAKHDAHLNALRLSALWRLDPARRLDPFLAVGAGLERTTIGDLNQNDLGLHAGAGIRWRFKAPLALRLDGRYVNVFLREPVKKHQDNVEFAIGLSFVPSAHAREAAVIPPPQPVTPPPAPPTPPPAPEPPPTPPAPPTPPPAPEKPTFQVTLLHFDTAKAKIRPDDLTRLQQAAEVLRADPNLRLAIEGHADSRGPEQYNQRLSERRANSALQWFLDQGFSKDRFEVRGFGELRPIADNKTRAGQQANRRVEIRAL